MPLAPNEIAGRSESRALLKSALEDARKKSAGLGLRQIAEKAGFRSPATLSMIFNGKRKLTPSAAEKIARALELSERKKKYLVALAKAECATSTIERQEALEQVLSQSAQREESPLALRQYRFLSIWYYPVIHVLAGLDGFRRDPQWIARRLGKGVTPTEIKRALGDMINLGLLEERGGKLIPNSALLATEERVRDVAIRKYHLQMIEKSRQAMDLPLGEREITGLTLSIPAEARDAVRQKMKKFRTELNEFLTQYGNTGEVFQLNFHLFPLTQSPEEESP